MEKQGICAKCGAGFFYSTRGGAEPKYCIRCAPIVRRQQTRDRVARHRAMAHMGIPNEQTPVKRAFKGAEHKLAQPDYSRVREYLASPEVRENIESLIASLDEETREWWREKLLAAIA